jgi:integrase/recombinase XerC
MRLRNLSDRYIEARSFVLRRTARQLDRDPLSATPETMRDWQQRRRVSPATLYNELVHLYAYTRWAIVEDLITHDPCAMLVVPKLPRRVPRPAVEAELLQAIATAPRDVRLMLVLAGFEGARAVELARLERADILDTATPAVLILRGKGNRERIVPLPAAVLAEIRRYAPAQAGPVFPRRDGQHTQNRPQRISQLVSEYLRAGGFGFTLHQARHRFATDIYRDTRDLRLVQELLGHASPQTTAVYTAYAVRDAVDAVRRISHRLDKGTP